MGARTVLPLMLAGLLGLSGCSTLDSLTPSMDSLNPWSSKGPKMAELTPIQASVEVRNVWKYDIGKAGNGVFYPAVVGDSVYVAAADGSLARLDRGEARWRINAGKPLSAGVGADGSTVVVGTSEGDVLAFAATDGKPLWQVKASSEILAPPAVSSDLIVVRSGDNRVVGLDVKNGQRKWLYQRPTPSLSLRSTAAPVFADRFVLVGFPGGKLVALAGHNGAPVWEGTVALPKGATELDRVSDVVSPPATVGPLGCAVAFQGRVACFDFSNGGNTLWARDMSSSAGLSVDNRNLYVTDDKGFVNALDLRGGSSVWKQEKLYLRQVTAPVPVGRNLLAVADAQGVVHVLSRDDGSFAGRLATDGSPVVSAPQRLGDQVVLQTKQGGVFALDVQ